MSIAQLISLTDFSYAQEATQTAKEIEKLGVSSSMPIATRNISIGIYCLVVHAEFSEFLTLEENRGVICLNLFFCISDLNISSFVLQNRLRWQNFLM